MLDLDSSSRDNSNYVQKTIKEDDEEENYIFGFLSKTPTSTFYDYDEFYNHKIRINDLKKNKTLYIGFTESYSSQLFEKNNSFLKPKIGVNLIEILDNKHRATYFIVLSKYSFTYKDEGTDELNKRGNMKYKIMKFSEFKKDSSAFEDFIFESDDLTNHIIKEIETLPLNYERGHNSAVDYYESSENYIQKIYAKLLELMNQIVK